MMDLPALYAAVCAKRPDLAVPNFVKLMGRKGPYWCFEGNYCPEQSAAALILARWDTARPNSTLVYKCDDKYAVIGIGHLCHSSGYHETQIEALAAYYLGETNG